MTLSAVVVVAADTLEALFLAEVVGAVALYSAVIEVLCSDF